MFETIRKWRLNHHLLAELIDMPYGTFANKISENQNAHAFTEAELLKLRGILLELSNDFKIV